MNSAGFALILSVLLGAIPVSAGAATRDIVDTAVAAGWSAGNIGPPDPVRR